VIKIYSIFLDEKLANICSFVGGRIIVQQEKISRAECSWTKLKTFGRFRASFPQASCTSTSVSVAYRPALKKKTYGNSLFISAIHDVQRKLTSYNSYTVEDKQKKLGV